MPTVILLHGRGADERSIIGLADDLPAGPAYVAVRAPIAEGEGYAQAPFVLHASQPAFRASVQALYLRTLALDLLNSGMIEDEQKQSQDWERRAMLAVREGRDDLARQALLRQQEYAQRAQSLFETWQKQSGETERLKDSLRQLNEKIEEARRKKNLLIAKQKRAEAQRQADEKLAQSRQFDAYNRFAAFVMHDLKNAVAQLQLVVVGATLQLVVAEPAHENVPAAIAHQHPRQHAADARGAHLARQ